MNRWVAVVRWARNHEKSQLTNKRRDTTTLDLRGRWLAAIKLGAKVGANVGAKPKKL